MPFWTLRRKLVAAVTVMVALTFGWAAVVVAVALAGAHDQATVADAIGVLGSDTDHRLLLLSNGFHMLLLRIIATRLGLLPFTSPAPNSPIRSNPRRNAAYFLAEGFKVPVTWVFNR